MNLVLDLFICDFSMRCIHMRFTSLCFEFNIPHKAPSQFCLLHGNDDFTNVTYCNLVNNMSKFTINF